MASRKLAQDCGMRVMQKQCASPVEEGSPPHGTQEQEKESPCPTCGSVMSLETRGMIRKLEINIAT
jgi:hypothetical protein